MIVWTSFGFKKSGIERNTIICRLRRVTFASNMVIKVTFINHLKTKHVDEYEGFSTLHLGSNKGSFHSSVKRANTMQPSLLESRTCHCPVPCLNLNLHHQLNGFPSVQDKSCAVWTRLTHRVQQNSEEEFSSIDELVQFIRAAWVVFIEDGVCEKTTRLPGQHL